MFLTLLLLARPLFLAALLLFLLLPGTLFLLLAGLFLLARALFLLLTGPLFSLSARLFLLLAHLLLLPSARFLLLTRLFLLLLATHFLLLLACLILLLALRLLLLLAHHIFLLLTTLVFFRFTAGQLLTLLRFFHLPRASSIGLALLFRLLLASLFRLRPGRFLLLLPGFLHPSASRVFVRVLRRLLLPAPDLIRLLLPVLLPLLTAGGLVRFILRLFTLLQRLLLLLATGFFHSRAAFILGDPGRVTIRLFGFTHRRFHHASAITTTRSLHSWLLGIWNRGLADCLSLLRNLLRFALAKLLAQSCDPLRGAFLRFGRSGLGSGNAGPPCP